MAAEEKLAVPLLITKDGTWLEQYSIADSAKELRRDIEMILEEGDSGADDIALWEKVDKLPSRPRKGTYLVTVNPKGGGHPYEIYEGVAINQDGIHRHIRRARESIEYSQAENDWEPGIWRQVDADIETEVRVCGIHVHRNRHKRSSRREKLA
jgi:hypothetical protein